MTTTIENGHSPVNGNDQTLKHSMLRRLSRCRVLQKTKIGSRFTGYRMRDRKLCRGRGWRPNAETRQNLWEYTGQSQRSHGFGFQSCVQYADLRCRGHTVQTMDDRMENEPPTQMMLQILTACTQVDTCLPGDACVPFCTLEATCVSSPRT
jgi:hypothetical protein